MDSWKVCFAYKISKTLELPGALPPLGPVQGEPTGGLKAALRPPASNSLTPPSNLNSWIRPWRRNETKQKENK
jgi:hypothetical protein